MHPGSETGGNVNGVMKMGVVVNNGEWIMVTMFAITNDSVMLVTRNDDEKGNGNDMDWTRKSLPLGKGYETMSWTKPPCLVKAEEWFMPLAIQTG